MSRSFVVTISLLALVTGSSGCTWVALAPDAGNVQIATNEAIAGCKKVGNTKTRTKLKVGFVERGEKKVAEELATLARNDAPELGGNTVVAEGPIQSDGTQRFAIYDCPDGTGTNP